MCGIVGFQDSDQFPDLAQALGTAVDALAHRGPDDSGVFLDPESGIGLGHRRLSVLDLTDAARQPMAAADGHLALTYNGEIYNFRALRRELASKGHGFRGEGDTEVLLAAWREWGADCLERLIGMFAMGVWDARARALFLARDRLGVKPLFYHRRGNGLRFASELKALVALPGFVRRPAPTALPLLLHYGYLPAPLAAFEDTFKLPPGHLAIWKSGELRIRRWWTPPAPATPRPISEAAALRELDALLNQAVSDRLVGDVPLGALLSGGIDSALVAAIMARRASGPVRTFTIGFGAGDRAEPDYDESGHAASVAEYLGTDHTVFRVTARDALEVIPRLPEIYDEPLADASAIPTVLVSALARTRVTVALSGDGGDELFAGYARYAGIRSAAALAGWIPRSIRRSAGRQMAAVPPGAVAERYRRISPGLPPPLRVSNVAEKWRKLAGALQADTLESAYRSAVSLWSRADVFDLTGRTVERGIWEAALRSEGGTIARLMAADRVTYLPDDLLAKVDRASMAAGLEVRVPLLDHRVVGFAAGLPSRLHYRAGVGKALLRRLLGRYLPPALFERPKMGFAVPVDAWLRGDLAELAADYFAPARLKRAGELDPETAGRFLRAHRRGDRDHGHRLWALLTWQMWRERWIERTS
ncbi:MAG: asparagine synthase (glutamine-hydrolyzing) [Desulfococcaceae bacterium]